jgi:predicted metal-binding protein
MSTDVKNAAIRPTPTGWDDMILICRKCSKKLNGGFGAGGDEPLRKALRGPMRAAGKRGRVGVLEVPCFGVCPKKAVTVAIASRPETFLVVPRGFDAGVLVRQLGGETEKSVAPIGGD